MSSAPRIPALLILAGAFGLGSLHHGGALVSRAWAAAETTPDTEALGACDMTQTPEALARAIRERQAALDERAAQLDAKDHELTLAKTALREEIARLETAENALRETLALAESASENDLAQLTKVYEAMKPAEAADLFAEMDPQFAAGFLARMSPQAAAGILAGLSADTAYAMSAHLAGRNANTPKE